MNLTRWLKEQVILYATLVVFLTGCLTHYQFGQGNFLENYQTITVPFVSGDLDGGFTKRLVKQVSIDGNLRYVNSCGDVTLNVEVIDIYNDNIGYRYDRKKSGRLTDSIIPTETRLNGIVEVILIEAGTGRVILGPTRLTAFADFDHDYYSTRDAINIFSLGQLTDYDEAYDTALQALYDALSQKIVEYVFQNW